MRPRLRALDRTGTATTAAWLVTLVATVLSAYALDAIAAAAGVALAGSGLLQGLDASVLLAVLAASYVAWAAALRVNLRANWDAAAADRHQHQRALEGGARPRAAARRERADAPGRGRDGVRRHRGRKGGAVLRRRVRGGAHRCGDVGGRDRLPRRREPRRRRLRVRARAAHAGVPPPSARCRRRRRVGTAGPGGRRREERGGRQRCRGGENLAPRSLGRARASRGRGAQPGAGRAAVPRAAVDPGRPHRRHREPRRRLRSRLPAAPARRPQAPRRRGGRVPDRPVPGDRRAQARGRVLRGRRPPPRRRGARPRHGVRRRGRHGARRPLAPVAVGGRGGARARRAGAAVREGERARALATWRSACG